MVERIQEPSLIIPPKPTVHNSHVSEYFECGYRYSQIHIEKKRSIPSVALIVGGAVDKGVGRNLTQKLESGQLLSPEAMRDTARDLIHQQWDESPILFLDKERELGLDAVKGQAVDAVIQTTMIHHEKLAPFLNPMPGGVHWKWVLECKGYPFDLAGEADLITQGTEETPTGPQPWFDLRDTKCLGKKPSRKEVEQRPQFTLYAMAFKVITSHLFRKIWMDALLKPTKTMGATIETFEASRTKQDFAAYQRRLEVFAEGLRKEVFLPADPSTNYSLCHRCGFAGDCPYYNGQKTVHLNGKHNPEDFYTKGELHEPRTKRTKKTTRSPIGADSTEWAEACTA